MASNPFWTRPLLTAAFVHVAAWGALVPGCSTVSASPDTQAPVAVARTAPEEAPASGDHCAQKPPPSPFVRSETAYAIPDVVLVDQAGQPVRVQEIAASDRPVALNFIFATCTTICPVMTATFAQMREELGDDADRVRMVSVTIDPEHDTPTVLAAYADKFDAPADWQFLTGTTADVESVLRGFEAFNGSKFNHRPITVLHAPGDDAWIRLDGLGSGTALANEMRPLLKSPGAP